MNGTKKYMYCIFNFKVYYKTICFIILFYFYVVYLGIGNW
jgi:hypothetical protein